MISNRKVHVNFKIAMYKRKSLECQLNIHVNFKIIIHRRSRDKRHSKWMDGQIEKALKLTTIPSLINCICILYYREVEIFEFIGKWLNSTTDKRSITQWNQRTSGKRVHFIGYGLNQILSTNNVKYQWDLSIGPTSRNEEGCNVIYIGISSMDTEDYENHQDGPDTEYYRWKATDQYSPGDKISLRLDMEGKTLSLWRNDEDPETKRNIQSSDDIKYRLMVLVCWPLQTVTITNFSKIP